jgi:hypothetical protein
VTTILGIIAGGRKWRRKTPTAGGSVIRSAKLVWALLCHDVPERSTSTLTPDSRSIDIFLGLWDISCWRGDTFIGSREIMRYLLY